jgi:tRNA modification GTPase
MMNSPDDTIVAISTPVGEGAIGIIRMSGSKSLEIADQIFFPKNASLKPSLFQSHQMYFGDWKDKDDILDEGLCSVMKAPHSYTQETCVEFYCHGSPHLLKKIIFLITEKGARLAEPGEFTKRAFLNGRMDLSQAEAVIDLIQAKSDLQRKYALKQLQGEFSRELTRLRDVIFDVMVESEANIDFPDYVPEGVTSANYVRALNEARKMIADLLKGAEARKILKEGLRVVLVGEPNVGKSSLLNQMAGDELAIVTEVPGTTRDAVEYEIFIHGVPVKFIDTAGLRDPENIVEKKGIEVTHKKFQQADLILFVLDVSKDLEKNALQSLLAADKEAMIVFNKMDLPARIKTSQMSTLNSGAEIFHTSALSGTGIPELKLALESWVASHSVLMESQYMLNARHQELLQKVDQDLISAEHALEKELGDDLVSSDLRNALYKLDEIVGRSVNEEMIQSIFARFCIGK